MKNILQPLLLMISILFVSNLIECYSGGNSSNVVKSDFGTEFWVAIPHVDRQSVENPLKGINSPIQLWISSKVNTKVYVESADSTSIPKTQYLLDTNQQLTISLSDTLMLLGGDDETPTKKGIHITSKDPISVEVFMAYTISGESYHAIPVEWLGKEYYTLNMYQDAGKYSPTQCQIVIIATENSTIIKYTPTVETQIGVLAGQTDTIILNKGQTFLIQSMIIYNQTQMWTTDLTGTHILANKPIAVISGHTKGAYPKYPSINYNLAYNYLRNAMIEMLIPVEYIGTDYVSIPTIDINRTVFGNFPDDKGDLIRFIGTQKNTTVWQGNPSSSNGLMQIGIKMQPGGWFDLNVMTDPAYYHSDKPIIVGQYGKGWTDGDNFFSQGMLIDLVPVNRWCNYAVFRVPKYVNSYCCLTFDTKNYDSILFDGTPLNYRLNADIEPVPGSPYSYTIINAGDGVHTVEAIGNATFGGYSYGNLDGAGEVFGYGNPIGINFYNSCNDSIEIADTAKGYVINGRITAIDLAKDSCASIHKITLKDSSNYSFNLANFTPGCKSANFSLKVNVPVDTAWAVMSIITSSGKEFVEYFNNAQIMSKPNAPILMSPQNGTGNLTNPITFTWQRTLLDSIYTLQIAPNENFDTLILNQDNISINQFAQGGFAVDANYYWRVKAINGYGESIWSEVWSFGMYNLNLSLISPPDNSENVSLANLHLIWSKPNYSVLFHLQLTKDSLFTGNLIIDETALADTTYPINLPQHNQLYYWKVRAKTADGYGNWTDTWNFKTESINDVLQSKTGTNYQLEISYLEPSYIDLSFYLNSQETISIDFYDIYGNKCSSMLLPTLLNSGNHKYQIAESNFSSGTYFIVFRTSEKTLCKKFIIVN